MNTLKEVLMSIKHLVTLIRTAYAGGFSECTDSQGMRWHIAEDSNRAMRIEGPKRIWLNDIEDLMSNIEEVFFIASKAVDFLKDSLETYESVKNILAPFILQEKISKTLEVRK